MRPSVAVIGSGVSGLTAAHVLRRTHDVTLLEAEDRLGGHAHTHTVETDHGTDRVDSGFIVHNDRTYPLLRRLFAELDIPVHPTEMSMSITCEGCGLSYAGGRKLRGLFAQRRRLLDPRYLSMLLGVKRFQRKALALLDAPESADDPVTYGDFLRQHGFSDFFVHHYAIPVVACVWSSGRATALEYPARYLFEFLRHHGFLSISGSPQWFTVQGGSRTYVDALAARLDDVRVSQRAVDITRKPDGVVIRTATDEEIRVDQVVIATHAADALALLTDPSDDERRLLGSIDYSPNRTVLHTDTALLPSRPDARASWNYRMPGCDAGDGAPHVTYWMNRLQGIDEARPYLVTLNDEASIASDAVIARMDYEHPIYTPASVSAQGELGRLNTGGTAFAGAYHGWGFHEDGCRSGLAAAESLGGRWSEDG